MNISAPNYTQTPNVFFDEFFKILSEGELRLVLVLVRQTFGWHKPADRISLSQLADKTGMSRTSVCRSLNQLLAKKLIHKHKFGDPGQERVYYALVVEEEEQDTPLNSTDGIESEEERALISNSLYQSPKETPPSLPKRPPQSPKETHKRNYTKETIQKNNNTTQTLEAAASVVVPSVKKAEKEQAHLPLSEREQKSLSGLIAMGFSRSKAESLVRSHSFEKLQQAAIYVACKRKQKMDAGEPIKNLPGFFLSALLGNWNLDAVVKTKEQLSKEVSQESEMVFENRAYADGLISKMWGVSRLKGKIRAFAEYVEAQTSAGIKKLYYKMRGFKGMLDELCRETSLAPS